MCFPKQEDKLRKKAAQVTRNRGFNTEEQKRHICIEGNLICPIRSKDPRGRLAAKAPPSCTLRTRFQVNPNRFELGLMLVKFLLFPPEPQTLCHRGHSPLCSDLLLGAGGRSQEL
jgi:hypothetical protein